MRIGPERERQRARFRVADPEVGNRHPGVERGVVSGGERLRAAVGRGAVRKPLGGLGESREARQDVGAERGVHVRSGWRGEAEERCWDEAFQRLSPAPKHQFFFLSQIFAIIGLVLTLQNIPQYSSIGTIAMWRSNTLHVHDIAFGRRHDGCTFWFQSLRATRGSLSLVDVSC